MNIILKKPIISEKSLKLASQSLCTFLVDRKARKPAIARAVEKGFNVDVVSVKTANFKEESKIQRSRRGYFTVPGFKKALVQLKAGQKISLFETEEKKEEKVEERVKEKRSLLKGTTVKVEKVNGQKTETRSKAKKSKEGK